MKQTNNAIKFLMAQYRAIFKNANIAMVAAMAAAALAAGSANADQTPNGVWDLTDFVNAKEGTGVKAETVTKDSTIDMSKLTTVDDKAFAYAGNDADTKIDGAKVTITGAKDKHLAVKGLALTNGAELTITNTGKEANSTIYGYTSGTQAGSGDQGTLSVVGSKINATSSSFQFNTVDIKNGSTITLGGKIEGDKASNDKAQRADWFIYSNIGTNKGTSGGVLTVENSTVNLNHESQLVSTTEVALNGATINFDGKMHEKGYSTSFIRGISGSTAGKVTVKGGTTLNATGTNGNGAIYANTIDVQSATLNIGAGKKFTLDGDWENASGTSAGKHNKATITLKDLTVNAEGNGTLIIGNATSSGDVTVTGTTVINGTIENHAAITVSGDKSVLAVDEGMIKSGTGLFKSTSSTLTLSGGTLQLNGLTGEKSLDLANDKAIAFSGAAAHNKIHVNGSGIIKGDNLVVSNTVTSGDSVTVDAVNLTLGSDAFDSSKNKLGVAALKAEKVTFVPSGDGFTLLDGLTLESAVANTINGAVTIGADKSGASISIKGNYKADKDIVVKSGSLSIGSSKNVGLSVTDGSLTLSGGKFETTATNGLVTLSNGKLDISKASSLAVASGTVAMTGTSALVLDGKVIKASGDAVDFQNGISGSSFTGDASSKLVFNNLESLTEAQFKDLKKDAAGFKGLFEGFTVTGLTVKDEMALGGDNGVQSGITGQYDNTQATLDGTTTKIEHAYDVGNLELTSGDAVNISGGSLSLNNGNANGASGNFVQKADGTVAGVTLTGATSALTLNNEGKIGAITADSAGNGVVNLGDVTGATNESAKVTVAGAIGSATANVGKVALSTNASLTVAGDVYAKQFNTAAGSSVSMTDKALVIGSGSAATDAASVILGNIEAGSIKVDGAAGVMFAGGGNIDIDTLTGTTNAKIQVGDDSEGGLGATLTTTNLVLGGGSIFVDPEFGKPAGFVVTENLANAGSTTSGAGTLDGKAYVGKNAVLGIGFAKTDAGAAELQALVAPYLVNNGGFDENGVKNALVINDSVTVASGNGFVVDSTLTSGTYSGSLTANSIKLGAGAALVITDKALDEGAKAAVTFSNNNGSGTITAEASSKVVLVGDFTAADKGEQIFAAVNSQGSGGTVSGDVAVEAAGGLLVGQISNGSIASLTLDPVAEKAIRSEVSAPVGQLFVDFANGKFDGATGAGYDFVVDAVSGKQFKAVDAAAHAATYAGAQQAAVVSVTTMADAMFGRVGAVGVEAASISATGSQVNGGVWLTPMYKSMDADGFNAEGVSYGSDVDAAGVAFGADTVNGNMRFGAVFNIGSGEADGKGQGNGLKDEFDYYGFGIYSAMGFGNFALVGDASMTVVSHDVQGLGLRGKADTTAVTMGLTGQYTVSTPMVDVTPHLGARFIRLNTDSYDLVGADGAIATTDFDVQNVFSVPLGVTLSKGFTTGGWTLAPSADLTITFNGGDTEAKSSTTFTGIKAINMNTEVLDEVTYGLTLGLGAQSGAFGTSFGINYTGSENTDSFGVSAQCRYMF